MFNFKSSRFSFIKKRLLFFAQLEYIQCPKNLTKKNESILNKLDGKFFLTQYKTKAGDQYL
jgi:hypothetical protein